MEQRDGFNKHSKVECLLGRAHAHRSILGCHWGYVGSLDGRTPPLAEAAGQLRCVREGDPGNHLAGSRFQHIFLAESLALAATVKIECGDRARGCGFASEIARHLYHGAARPLPSAYVFEFRSDARGSFPAISGVARAFENPACLRLLIENPGGHRAISGYARGLGNSLRCPRRWLPQNRLLADLPSRCLRSEHFLYGGIHCHCGRIDRLFGLRLTASRVSMNRQTALVPDAVVLSFPCGQKTRRGPSLPEKSRFLVLIDVSVSCLWRIVISPMCTAKTQSAFKMSDIRGWPCNMLHG